MKTFLHNSFKLTMASVFALAMLTAWATSATAVSAVTPAEARAIAKDAFIYGYPVVDNYRIMYDYYVDKSSAEFKAPFNGITNIPRVYTPADAAVQTPNSDTPYSWLGYDLRAEPIVLGVPEMEKNRYYSLQFTDGYTFNFDYVGTRTTGNGAGHYMLAGPNWTGEKPANIDKVFHSETEFGTVVYRTQLFDPSDIDNVKKVQAGYTVQPLSEFLGTAAPTAATAIDFPTPVAHKDYLTDLEYFNILSFVLGYAPVVPSEVDLRERFEKIGVGAGKTIDVASLDPATKEAMLKGVAEGWAEVENLLKTKIATGEVTSGDLFGTREFQKNNYLYRMAGTILGIYANSVEEALYPIYRTDADGKGFDSKNKYTLTFEAGQLPPVNAFWSLTMYNLPQSLLVDNKLNRYLINSPMLPDLKKNADGGVTLYIQSNSPGADLESNWLPAPEASAFWMALRLYWPTEAALKGDWKAPAAKRAAN